MVQPHKQAGKFVPVLISAPHHEFIRQSGDVAPCISNSHHGCFTSGNQRTEVWATELFWELQSWGRYKIKHPIRNTCPFIRGNWRHCGNFCVIYVRIIRGSNTGRGRTSRSALWLTQPPTQWISASFPGVKPAMALSRPVTSIMCLASMNVGPCHHGMARPPVADGGTAYNIINWISSRGQPTRGGPPSWGLDEVLTNPLRKKVKNYP